MDVLQLSGAASAGLQGMMGFQPPRMADVVNRMVSTVDGAVKVGKLTDAQAAPLREDIQRVATVLAQNGDGSASGLSVSDRQRIGNEIRDLGRQLRLALGSSDTAAGIGPKTAAGPDAPRGERQGPMSPEASPTYGRNGRLSPAAVTPQSSFSLLA